MPDAISASSSDDGPTSGTTRTPAACAAATSAAPGSATPGQPASDSRPMSVPVAGGRQQRGQRRRVGSSGSGRMSSAAIGCGGSSDFRNARAGFGVSTTQWRSVRAMAIVRAGRTSAGGDRAEQVGNEVERAAHQREAGRRSSDVDAFGAQQARERDQRQADERGRIVACDALEQHDAERFGLAPNRRSRTAARGRGRPRSRRRRACGTCWRRRPARCGSGRSRASTSATPVWKTTVRPTARAAARTPARGRPACRSARPSQSATWSEPITSASAKRAATARALASDRRSAVAAGTSPGSGVLVDVRRGDLERQAQPLEQGAPVARRRAQHQRPVTVPHCFC